jgi:cell division protein FtsL
MRREGTRKLLLIVSIFIIIVLIVSSYIIYIGSLNNQIINVTIEVDKSNYDINENVTFTLTALLQNYSDRASPVTAS